MEVYLLPSTVGLGALVAVVVASAILAIAEKISDYDDLEAYLRQGTVGLGVAVVVVVASAILAISKVAFDENFEVEVCRQLSRAGLQVLAAVLPLDGSRWHTGPPWAPGDRSLVGYRSAAGGRSHFSWVLEAADSGEGR